MSCVSKAPLAATFSHRPGSPMHAAFTTCIANGGQPVTDAAHAIIPQARLPLARRPRHLGYTQKDTLSTMQTQKPKGEPFALLPEAECPLGGTNQTGAAGRTEFSFV